MSKNRKLFLNVPYAEIFWHYARLTPFYKEILLRQIEDNYLSKIRNKMEKYKNNRFLYFFVNIRIYMQYKFIRIIICRLKLFLKKY